MPVTENESGCIPVPQVAGGWRYTPHLVIFFSSACIMVVELVAGRLVARHLGSSLYTWTSIIGVVLAGMSIGNYLGGRMADRWRPARSLGWLFLAASVTCVISLGLNNLIGATQQTWEVMFPVRVVLSTLLIFILPALALGTISPVTAKMALERSNAVGTTIGSVYAWGAVGSILGTFAAGFFLIAALGSKGVVLLIAGGLGFTGLFLGPRRLVHAVWVSIVALFFWLSQTDSAAAFQTACNLRLQEGESRTIDGNDTTGPKKHWAPYPFVRDGNYQFVKVYDSEEDRGSRVFRTLVLDYLIHGYFDLQDPGNLRYSYEKLYAGISRAVIGERKEVAAFFLGGGSYTFPRWIQKEWPDAVCDVAEIDPLVLEANHHALGLARDTAIRTYLMDARIAVDEIPKGRRYDLILGDAFTDLSVPYHLTTVEFQGMLAERLKPEGALLQNLIDDFTHGGLFLGAYMLTLQRVFKHVYIFCTDRHGLTDQRDTFVLLATNLDDPELHRFIKRCRPGHSVNIEGSLLTDAQMQELARRCKNRILTDDNAPVENLLEPVVRNRGRN